MRKKFALWFAYFVLSFLVQSLGWAEQGKAFMFIKLGLDVLWVLICLVRAIAARVHVRFSIPASGATFIIVLMMFASILIVLFATWVATQLFDVDFYVTYQIMTFGQCLCSSKTEKDNN